MKRKMNNRVDANQTELVKFFEGCGAVVRRLSGDPTIGTDLIVSFRGRNEYVEVKDGSKPPSKRKLTEDELKFKDELERVGCVLHVIENEEQALELLNSLS